MRVLPCIEKTSMSIAKNQPNKKSLQKQLKAGTVNRSKRDLALAREEEEIARWSKNSGSRKEKRVKTTVISASTVRAPYWNSTANVRR